MTKHGLAADATTLELGGEPASKKGRYTPQSTTSGSFSNLTPNTSASPLPGSSPKTPIEDFDLDDSDDSDSDSDIIDLTKETEISAPKPKQPVHPAIKPEPGITLECLTSPLAKTEFDEKIAGLQFGAAETPLNTSITPIPLKPDPSNYAPGFLVAPKAEFGTSHLIPPGIGQPPFPHQIPKLEPWSNLQWNLKPEHKHDIDKKEPNGAGLFYYPPHPMSYENTFNPILGEVGAFPNAPPPNASDEAIHNYLLGHAIASGQLLSPSGPSENEKAIQEIIESLPVDERRLASMPKARQPLELKTRLLDHQLQALQWMREKEKPELPGPGDSKAVQLWKRFEGGAYQNIATNAVLTDRPPTLVSGGILADDMGLGKTLEMISLILTAPGSGPTLIVAPKGVMSNWEKQIQAHVAWNHYPKIMRFHSKSAARDERVITAHKIVITTYHKMVTDAVLLTKIKWRRLIFDEGHNIRNANTRMAEVACNLEAKSRWVCTGTPIINSLSDLHSLAKFLRIDGGLTHAGVFKKAIGRNKQNLQAFMLQFCLRRTKVMKFVNLKIPEKQEDLVRLKFSEHERQKYNVLFDDARKAAQLFFRLKERGESDMSLWNNVLERLLRLRQMCDHWSLCKKKEIAGLFRRQMQTRPEQFTALEQELRGTLLKFVESSTVCGVCGDPLDPSNQPVLTSCRHGFCKNCLDSKVESLDQSDARCPLCNEEFDRKKLVMLDMKDLEGLVKETGSEEDDDNDDYEPPERQPSTKVQGVLREISETLRRKKSKVVIFSQWTSFLDILECNLVAQGHEFTRIDGTMTTEERDAAIKTLENNRSVRIMLASLRVASVGISLVAADTVIMADTWWAPAIEEQAIDRVHRLGQTRDVTVKRIVIEDSVEEKVLITQDKKRELIGTAWQEDVKLLMTQDDKNRVKMVKDLLSLR